MFGTTTLQWATSLDASGFASGAQRVNSSLGEMGIRTQAAQMSMGGLGTMLGTLANPLTAIALAATAAGVALHQSVQAAAAWETSMAEISKTTGVAGQELKELSDTLMDIRTRTGATAESIAGSVVTAGSIGIPKEELAAFAEVSLQMASAFRMSADTAAEAMGKIGNVVKPAEMAWTEFMQRAGSSVNILADSMATSEAEILTGMKHLGATMAMLKPPIDTVPAWQALVATVQSLGLSADTAGEAIQDAFQYAARDAKGGISGLLGVTGTELQEMLRTDAVGAMKDFAEAISDLPIEEQAEALKMFGMTGQKAIQLLMGDLDKTSGSFTKLDEAIKLSNMAWEDAKGLAEAYGKSQDTFNVSWAKFAATIEVASTKLGTVLLPILGDVLDDLSKMAVLAIDAGEAIGKIMDEHFGTNEEAPGADTKWIENLLGYNIDDYRTGVETAKTYAKEAAETYTTTAADEIAESGEIAEGISTALSEAESAVIESGKNAGELYGSQFAAQAKLSGLNDMDLLSMINSQTTKANEETRRSFEHLNQQYEMVMSKGGSGWYYSLYNAERALLGQTNTLGDYSKMDPVEAFEKITGFPAPDEGTAEYYRMMGDEISAAKIEMQKELSEGLTFEIPSLGWSVFAGEYEGAQDIADGFEEALQNIDWENLPGIIESGENLKKVILDSSSSAVAAEPFLGLVDEQIAKYQAALVAGVADSASFMTSEMKRLGELSKDAFSDGFLSESERGDLLGLEPELQLLKSTFPAEFEAAGGDAILAMIEAIESGDLPGAMALIGKQAGEEFAKNMLGGVALLPKTLAELVADPDALKSAAVDQDRFWQGTVLPAIKNYTEEAKRAFDSGQFTTEQIYENYIKPMGQLTDYMPGWVNEINSMFKSGAIDIDDYIYILDEMTKKASDSVETTNAQTKAVQDQTVGYDNLKSAMEDCSECAVSEFGQWQEAQDNLFQDSYIGSGGQEYVDWKNRQIAAIAETQAAIQAMGGVSVGQQYEMPETKISIGADTSPAETAKANLESDITAAKPDMTMGIETQAAMDEVNELVNYITTANPTMSVQVSVSAYAGEIQAIVANAIRSALA